MQCRWSRDNQHVRYPIPPFPLNLLMFAIRAFAFLLPIMKLGNSMIDEYDSVRYLSCQKKRGIKFLAGRKLNFRGSEHVKLIKCLLLTKPQRTIQITSMIEILVVNRGRYRVSLLQMSRLILGPRSGHRHISDILRCHFKSRLLLEASKGESLLDHAESAICHAM